MWVIFMRVTFDQSIKPDSSLGTSSCPGSNARIFESEIFIIHVFGIFGISLGLPEHSSITLSAALKSASRALRFRETSPSKCLDATLLLSQIARRCLVANDSCT